MQALQTSSSDRTLISEPNSSQFGMSISNAGFIDYAKRVSQVVFLTATTKYHKIVVRKLSNSLLTNHSRIAMTDQVVRSLRKFLGFEDYRKKFNLDWNLLTLIAFLNVHGLKSVSMLVPLLLLFPFVAVGVADIAVVEINALVHVWMWMFKVLFMQHLLILSSQKHFLYLLLSMLPKLLLD